MSNIPLILYSAGKNLFFFPVRVTKVRVMSRSSRFPKRDFRSFPCINASNKCIRLKFADVSVRAALFSDGNKSAPLIALRTLVTFIYNYFCGGTAGGKKTSRRRLRANLWHVYTFRDSSRLQLLVFDVYGSWSVIDGTPGTISPTISTPREKERKKESVG